MLHTALSRCGLLLCNAYVALLNVSADVFLFYTHVLEAMTRAQAAMETAGKFALQCANVFQASFKQRLQLQTLCYLNCMIFSDHVPAGRTSYTCSFHR